MINLSKLMASRAHEGDDGCEDGERDEAEEYELASIMIHQGTADRGHYYAYIRDQTGAGSVPGGWYCFNDAQVRGLSTSRYPSEQRHHSHGRLPDPTSLTLHSSTHPLTDSHNILNSCCLSFASTGRSTR